MIGLNTDMPYVKQWKRPNLDRVVFEMQAAGIKADGDLNYILFKFARTLEPSYNNLKNYRAELRETADEIGRRLLAPYEDTKIIDNGDVY